MVVPKAHYKELHLSNFATANSKHVKLIKFVITLYYIKNQLDATLAVLFISHCKITLHVSDAFCIHHQEY